MNSFEFSSDQNTSLSTASASFLSLKKAVSLVSSPAVGRRARQRRYSCSMDLAGSLFSLTNRLTTPPSPTLPWVVLPLRRCNAWDRFGDGGVVKRLVREN